MITIVWDEPKRQINLSRHGLDFADLDEWFFLDAMTVPQGKPLQHQATTQCIGLPTTRARGHRHDGPKANHALTFNLDHSSGAAQFF